MSKARALLTGVQAIAKTIKKPAVAQSSESPGFYLTLFRKLLASIPAELRNDPVAFTQIKLLNVAITNLTEDNAKMIAQHIKAFGNAIKRCEDEAGITSTSNNSQSDHAPTN